MRSRMERILNLLVDEIEERLEARRQPDVIEPAPVPSPPVAPIVTKAEVPVEPATESKPIESEPDDSAFTSSTALSAKRTSPKESGA